MTTRLLSLALAYLSITGMLLAQKPPTRIVDLSYAFSETSVYWPTAEGFKLNADWEGLTDQGFYYTANSFAAAEHGGTHLDAPIHFAEGKSSADEIPLKRLIAPAVLIDLEGKVGDNADYQISVADLEEWEASHGQIPDDHILLFRTGWGRFYPDPLRYLGTARKGTEAVAELHFPGLHPQAAEWLVKNRKIAAVGLDTASIDYGQSKLFESHQVLFKAEIPAFENVANLQQLPRGGYEIIALPMKIEGGSGAPLRIVAVFR
ncbi:MAG: cyclase family protein [Acidobacteriota bacterium]|nr:MAG: cyclase family protein [Acidobacteriota bacterium]